MQDLLQLSLGDEEVAELFEGINAGDKIKLTVEVTVSEIDDERLSATVDMVHDDVNVEESEDFEEEEDYEDDAEDEDEDEEYEEDEAEEE